MAVGKAMAAHRFQLLRPAANAELCGKKARIRNTRVKSTRNGIAVGAWNEVREIAMESQRISEFERLFNLKGV